MRMNKKAGTVILFLAFTLLFVDSASALGISPAKKVIDFEPSLEQTVEFKVLNGENKDMKVVIYAEDVLEGGSIFVNTPELEFSPEESEKIVKYTFKLPQKFEKPGTHEFRIVAREIPKGKAVDGTFVGASVSVVHLLRVNVPYPGKYATAELKIAEVSNEKVNFIVYVNNFGTQKIVSAKGIIDIFGPTNEKLETIETALVSVDSGERSGVNAIWDGALNSGKYYAKLTVIYDGDIAETEEIFEVGRRLVEILNIYAKDFRLGEIARFNILVENNWPSTISDVYTDLLISEKGQEIGRFKSASEDIPGLAKEELTAYWDTAGVEKGDYDAKISLYYDDKVVEKDMLTKIGLNSISFSGFTGAVIGDSSGGSDINLLAALVVFLIIINIGWFTYFFLKKRRKK